MGLLYLYLYLTYLYYSVSQILEQINFKMSYFSYFWEFLLTFLILQLP